jgi:hypothetical protein
MLNENLLVFVDQIRGDRERLLDVAYHQRGVWESVPAGLPWTPPDQDGYRYLRDATVRPTRESLTLTARMGDDWRIALTLAGGEPSEAITATGVGAHVEDRVPMVLWRRRAKETALAWGMAVDGQAASLAWLPVRDADGNALPSAVAAAVQVVAADGQTWRLVTNPERRSLCVPLPDGSEWRTDAAFAVQ